MGEIKYGRASYGALIRRGVMNTVTVGKYCSIAVNVIVDSGFDHDPNLISTYPFNANLQYPVPHNVVCKGDVNIGNDVWIGESCYILAGVTIGDGAIIGVGAVVTKDVKPYEVVGGIPAKHIRFRFNEQDIAKLLALKWWDLTEEQVKKISPYLSSSKENAVNELENTIKNL